MIPFCCHQKNRLQNYFLAQLQDGTQNVSWLIERAAPGGVEDEEVSPFAVGCSNFSCRYVMLLNRAWKTLYGRRVLFFFSFLFFSFLFALDWARPVAGIQGSISCWLVVYCVFFCFSQDGVSHYPISSRRISVQQLNYFRISDIITHTSVGFPFCQVANAIYNRLNQNLRPNELEKLLSPPPPPPILSIQGN